MNYDLAIIGAGIQGAGVAQAASAAGYRVIVLEQFDSPAQGTSSRSSKLIHGGLRYLETGQFSLVRECLRERALLLKNAPQLVKLVPFYIPVYNNSQRSALKIAAGLSIYSLLSLKPFHIIPKRKWSTLDGIKQRGLKAVFKYYDAQTDDAALTRAVLKSAESMGTEICFNCSFESAEIHDDSCTLYYNKEDEQQTINCSAIVNASGSWVQEITERVPGIEPQPDIELVQGTHIEVPGNLKQGIYYLEAPQDQRAVFVMPWKDHLMIGTTETLYQGDPAKVTPLESEIEYLLEVYNHYFDNKLITKDVINAFAGLRVLPKNKADPFSRSRDTLIIGNKGAKSRFWTLYGGKLTAYRATAEQAMKKLSPILPIPRSPIDTRTLNLTTIKGTSICKS